MAVNDVGTFSFKGAVSLTDLARRTTAYWKMDENSDNSVRADYFGNLHLYPTNVTTNQTGKQSKAVTITDGVLIANDNALLYPTSLNPFSWNLWVYPTAKNNGRIFVKQGSYTLYISNLGEGVLIVNYPSIGQVGAFGGIVNLNAWNMISCGTYPTAGAWISVNNETIQTAVNGGSLDIPQNTNVLEFGSQSGSFDLAGSIDEVSYFRNYQFTQSDVGRMYNSGAGRFYPNY